MTVKAVFHTSAKHEELEDLSLEHSIKKKEGKLINDLKSQLLIKKKKNEKKECWMSHTVISYQTI